MAASVKSARNFGIDRRLDALRLQISMTEVSTRIGKNMRRRRDELGLKQREVASRMNSEGVDAQRISDWERGVNEPSGRYMAELVTALEVDDFAYFMAPLGSSSPDLMDALSDGPTNAEIDRKLDRVLAELASLRAALVDETRTLTDVSRSIAGKTADLLDEAAIAEAAANTPDASDATTESEPVAPPGKRRARRSRGA